MEKKPAVTKWVEAYSQRSPAHARTAILFAPGIGILGFTYMVAVPLHEPKVALGMGVVSAASAVSGFFPATVGREVSTAYYAAYKGAGLLVRAAGSTLWAGGIGVKAAFRTAMVGVCGAFSAGVNYGAVTLAGKAFDTIISDQPALESAAWGLSAVAAAGLGCFLGKVAIDCFAGGKGFENWGGPVHKDVAKNIGHWWNKSALVLWDKTVKAPGEVLEFRKMYNEPRKPVDKPGMGTAETPQA